MADAMQAFGQHVHQEAPDKLGCAQRHGRIAPRPFDPVILDLESDAIRIGTDQPSVGDGDAVGMCASYLAQARGRMFGMLTKGGRPLIK